MFIDRDKVENWLGRLVANLEKKQKKLKEESAYSEIANKQFVNESRLGAPSLSLEYERNMGFACAVTAISIVYQLLSVEKLDVPLKIALYASALDIPISLGYGHLNQKYINNGEKLLAFMKTKTSFWTEAILNTLGLLLTIIALGACIYHLSGLAFALFVLSIIFSFHVDGRHYSLWVKWYRTQLGHPPPDQEPKQWF